MIVYYDSRCKLCTRTAKIWKRLDWRKQLIFRSFRSLENYPEAMAEEIHIEKGGQWFKGYHAVVQIVKALPLLWPFIPFLYLAQWLGFGHWLYMKIAQNRALLPIGQCEDGSCSLQDKS